MTNMQATDAETIVALTVDNGFCYNSEKHNKNSHVKVCDQNPMPCLGALDYMLGSTSEWLSLLQSGLQSNPCGTVLHGTYDFGRAPSAGIVRLEHDRVGFMAVHEGATDFFSDCGKPVLRPGKLVLDSFAFTRAGNIQ